MDYEKVDRIFKTNTFDWLPVPDYSSASQINSKHYKTFLPKLYTDLQVIAAGIELVFFNEKYAKFKETPLYLRLVLCELFTVLYECGLKLPDDVTRETIPSDCASLVDQTSRKARDFIIFREYVKILEYILRVFRNHTRKSSLIIKNMK